MQKTPTIFERDWDGDRSRVVNEPHADCDWVFNDEGVATRKLDGSCCAIIDGVFLKRREVKRGKPEPYGFRPVSEDAQTGKRIGWVEVGNGSDDKWFREAFDALDDKSDGTFELVGPKSQGNPERFDSHMLVRHSDPQLVFSDQPPRDFDGLQSWFSSLDIEGIVFHHPDGRMAKIKLRDFGLKRATQEAA